MKWTDIGVACAAALIGIAVCGAPAFAQQKTAKECQAEWKANKAAIQASGKTKKAFVSECRGQTAAAQPAQQPTPAPAPPQAASPATPERTTTGRQRQTATAPTGAGQFSTEVAAKAHCPSDTVVWVNLESKIYHFNGTRDYGHTKRGAYMCERETYGFRAAKNEKHP
jgi:hypothetical protein